MEEKDRDSYDSKYMKEAIRQAKKAALIDEVPIGCVIHAEIIAIQKASKKLNDWRLEECTMYVTLEPCPMCAGAIVQARIPKVVIGAMNAKAGCAGSVLNILEEKGFNHQVEKITGVLEEECRIMMKDFFRELRQRKKEKKMHT